MPDLKHDCGDDPPDLLKRFVPTRFRGTLHVGGAEVFVHSNDSTIVDELAPRAHSFSVASSSFLWKLVYDCDAPSDLLPRTIIACGPTALATLGPGCLIGVDYDRSELMAFLGIPGNHPAFRETILPLLTELTREAIAAAPSSHKAMADLATMGGSHA